MECVSKCTHIEGKSVREKNFTRACMRLLQLTHGSTGTPLSSLPVGENQCGKTQPCKCKSVPRDLSPTTVPRHYIAGRNEVISNDTSNAE